MPGLDMVLDSSKEVEFSGMKGRFFAWFLTSPLRKITLHKIMGNPDPRFMELLALQGSETVVDFGSGSGHHSLMVAKKLKDGGKVIATDVSKEMLNKLRKLAKKRGVADKVEAIEADCQNLSAIVPDGSADCGISVATWHHINGLAEEVLQTACNEMFRTLKPGGRIVVVDLGITKKCRQDRALGAVMKGHDRPYSMEDVAQYMTNAGFEQQVVEKARPLDRRERRQAIMEVNLRRAHLVGL